MNAIDIFCSLIFGGSLLFLAVFVLWALLVIAKISDDISEEQWKQYQAEHGDEEDSL